MTLQWLEPGAFWGLALLVIPLLVHLLIRQQRRRVLFPTLRFVRPVRLSAVRHRAVNEWVLLAIRVGIVLAAVLALAAPVIVSELRSDAWRDRVSRAVVVAGPLGPDGMAAAEEEQQSSFASARFDASPLADALRDASIWLPQQPPSSKELVILGTLREGELSSSMLDGIPGAFGVRFLPFASSLPPKTFQFLGAALSDTSVPANVEVSTTPDDDSTRVTYRRALPLESPITVRAAAGNQRAAEAALRAMWTNAPLREASDRRVVVVLAGGDDQDSQPLVVPATVGWMRTALEALPGVRGGQHRDRLVIHIGLAGHEPSTPAVLAQIARAALLPDLRSREPRLIAAADLARWARPPAPHLDLVPPVDQGDRRWLWALALALLALEQVIRRRPRLATTHGEAQLEEQRVA